MAGRTVLIAPSLLSADFSALREDVEMVNRSEAAWFHIDVMDGIFVPNISFGFPVLSAIKKYASKPLDVHLMIKEPAQYVSRFIDSGASNVSFHIEAVKEPMKIISEIKGKGAKAGIAINPETAIDALKDVIAEIDLVCLMSVHPGFGGQKFMPSTFSKIKELRKLMEESGSKALIEVDGGVDLSNFAALKEAGADVLVSGNCIFSADKPEAVIARMKND